MEYSYFNFVKIISTIDIFLKDLNPYYNTQRILTQHTRLTMSCLIFLLTLSPSLSTQSHYNLGLRINLIGASLWIMPQPKWKKLQRGISNQRDQIHDPPTIYNQLSVRDFYSHLKNEYDYMSNLPRRSCASGCNCQPATGTQPDATHR